MNTSPPTNLGFLATTSLLYQGWRGGEGGGAGGPGGSMGEGGGGGRGGVGLTDCACCPEPGSKEGRNQDEQSEGMCSDWSHLSCSVSAQMVNFSDRYAHASETGLPVDKVVALLLYDTY